MKSTTCIYFGRAFGCDLAYTVNLPHHCGAIDLGDGEENIEQAGILYSRKLYLRAHNCRNQ